MSNEQDFPNYSFGDDVNNPGNIVFKVDEGTYAGTVFNFADVQLDESKQLKYSVNFQLYLKNGILWESIEDSDLKEFYENVATKVLLDVISQTKEVAQTEANKDIIVP